MTDTTPLYCPCGNQLGALREDGAFVSQHKGRAVAIVAEPVPPAKVRCENCGHWTEVDKLLRVV